ncbi:hypothetical protein K438DRAFT_803786 [Mycena galopus ATCC 62051]|nr:hypothetical protein K438DRAFT_803786 [Mycena galopus ATCC 62051]
MVCSRFEVKRRRHAPLTEHSGRSSELLPTLDKGGVLESFTGGMEHFSYEASVATWPHGSHMKPASLHGRTGALRSCSVMAHARGRGAARDYCESPLGQVER